MASSEQIILKAFIDNREDFEKYGHYIIGLDNLDKSMDMMLNYIKQFYEKYPKVNNIPEPELRIYLSSHDTYNFAVNNDSYIKNVYKTTLRNNSLKLDVIEHSVEKHFMSKIIDKVALVLDSNKAGILSTIQDDIDRYHNVIRNPPKEMYEYVLDLKALIKEEIVGTGVPFVNPTPNNVIRGMKTGQLGLIYAYVDTGKTSYGVSNLCSAAQYLQSINSDRPVIYGCNEEAVHRVSLRAVQCMTNWSSEEIAHNEKQVDAIIKNKGFNRIKFIDHVTDMNIVEKVLLKYKPRVMFIDQGTKIKLPRSKAQGVDALEEIFNTLRNLAKLYECCIVSMAQGGDDCFGKKEPALRDIYGSKSAIQGELDWAISLGVDGSDVRYQNWRYFNITKNKGDKQTYACRFDTKRCQFKEVI
jgi:hypothetical protein